MAATAAGLINVSMIDGSPWVVIRRGEEVPDDFWFRLPLLLRADDGASRQSGTHLEVPVERFIDGRARLKDLCTTYNVGLDLDEGVGDLLRRTRTEESAVRERVRRGRVPAPALPEVLPSKGRFSRELRPFQERDLAKLLDLEHGSNFSVPGAGKTAVTYAIYEGGRTRGRVDRLLVIAPLSAYEAWEDEAERCFEDPPKIHRFDGRIPYDTEVLLVNYQKLNSYYDQLAGWVIGGRTHLVIDEAHRMKRGRDGQWGRACLDLAHLAVRRDVLTGTPAPQAPRDFVALVDFVWPGQARSILPRAALRKDPPADASHQVSEALAPLFVRTTKSELGLDPPNLRVEPTEMKPLQAEIYEALRNRYAGTFDLSLSDQAMLARMGEVTMYLLEAASNPRLLAGGGHAGAAPFRYPALSIPPGSRLWELVERYSDHEIPRKFEKLALLVEQHATAGRKTLVWSNFVGNLLDLERLLARHQPALLYGAVPTEETATTPGGRTRQGELARFRNDARCTVLLANPAAMAEGISLHEHCHEAIYVDRTFNAGQYLQSLDRIHRLGLEPGVETNITFLVSTGTIDERVDDRLGVKSKRLAAMLNDPDLVTMALPDEEDYGAMLEDVEDLQALFEHLSHGDD